MVAVEIFVGVAFIIASALAFWIALPRHGQVRSFLSSDQAQAYYAVALLIGFVFGVVNIVRGLTATVG
jgi:hypothetical protein